ncbi:hypothetical protein BDQ12DRAFT_632172 [Crucibulum laeve]|uniref:Uncharacterized protein n=1 Tax=Crucibulum laeve TaxID=68775 RepID=A0A5C3M0D2_9AGAR|nr:hypothetical protein BDQ12DRAFT_632172 [Crucibulum laeve]
MFNSKLFVTFLTLSLVAFTVEAAPTIEARQNQKQAAAACPAPIVKTVTVTARAAAPTLNNGSNNGAVTSAIAVTAKGGKTTAVAATATAKNNNGGKGNTKTTSTAAAAATTAKGGKGNTKTTSSVAAAATTAKTNQTNNNGGKNNTKTTSSAAAAATSAAAGSTGDPQKSLTLDPKVIASGFANDGQDVPTAGQVASLTSTNNFINFCLTVPNLPITNGKQITTGSCNPAPIGVIPSTDNMPSSKFTFPANFGTVKADTPFTISMAIQNMQTGFFVNAQENYFAAPQFLNAQGQIQGHSHVVVEQLSSITQTTPTDPKKFAFFKGLNAAASNGVLTADVTAGLPAGFYKLSSINSAANHQPVIVPVAQHGSLDDAIYVGHSLSLSIIFTHCLAIFSSL